MKYKNNFRTFICYIKRIRENVFYKSTTNIRLFHFQAKYVRFSFKKITNNLEQKNKPFLNNLLLPYLNYRIIRFINFHCAVPYKENIRNKNLPQ